MNCGILHQMHVELNPDSATNCYFSLFPHAWFFLSAVERKTSCLHIRSKRSGTVKKAADDMDRSRSLIFDLRFTCTCPSDYTNLALASGYLHSPVQFDLGELFSLRFAQALVKGNQTPRVWTFVISLGCSASEPLLTFEESPTLLDRTFYSSQNLKFPYPRFPSHPCSKSAVR